MNNTFEHPINPIFSNFDKQVKDLNEKDQNHVDFDLYMQGSTLSQYCTDNEHAFYKNTTVAFPEEIARQIEQPRSDYKLGFLKAINYVWLCRGTALYLWNFIKKDSKVFRYDSSEVIEHVDIATFTTQNQLVVSTRNYIYLHTIQEGEHKIQLATGVVVNSTGVVMSNIVTTRDTKRVFMKGDDGHLYELNLVFSNNDDIPTDGNLTCHTMNPVLRYLTMFFKSPPVASLKSLVLDDADNLLYMLLSDSSIHVAAIEGIRYAPLQRYMGENLESIHLVQDTKKPSIMAVAKNGDRLFFQNEYPDIKLTFTRSAPPLPGSILFNNLTDQHADLSFYQQGIFASVLSKSEKHYLVLTNISFASVVDSNPVLVEDLYHELLDSKVWSIIEEGQRQSKFKLKSTLESFDTPDRQISTLTNRGITRYNKQHIADYLESALRSLSPAHLNTFVQRYGGIETCYVAHVLACSPRQTPHAVDFIRQSIVRQEGLLLYFARIVKDIWAVNIKSEKVPKENFLAVQRRLKELLNLYQQYQIPTTDVMDFVLATIESISFICFVNDLDWEQIAARLDKHSPSCTFCEFVTTEHGAKLAQNIVYTAIKTSKLANASNNYNFIGNFLSSDCSAILGKENVIYFKGIENLYAAHNNTDKNDKKQALKLGLQHFKSAIDICDFQRITTLAHQFSDLGDHIAAIDLAFTSYSRNSLEFHEVQTIVLEVIKEAIETKDQKYAINVITKALEMTNSDRYHFAIYNWLLEQEHDHILASLEIPSVFTFIKTQITDLRKSLILLELYYAHRHEFAKSADTIYQLATEADQIGLLPRVQALKKACEYLPQAEGFSKEKCQTFERKYKVAQVQYEIYESLLKQKNPDKKIFQDFATRLIPEYDLLKCAHTQSLYEEGLSLMSILEEYNWEFAKAAWENIITSCNTTKEQVQSKLKALAKRLYPSIPSFPVYIIYEVLQSKCAEFGENFAELTLIEAGIPSEVVSDAKNVNQ